VRGGALQDKNDSRGGENNWVPYDDCSLPSQSRKEDGVVSNTTAAGCKRVLRPLTFGYCERQYCAVDLQRCRARSKLVEKSGLSWIAALAPRVAGRLPSCVRNMGGVYRPT